MTCCPNLLTSATECEFYKGFLKNLYLCSLGFPGGSVGKESACNVGDLGSIPGLGRSPGEGKGYPFQYSGLENSVDCIVHRVEKSQTRLSDFHLITYLLWLCRVVVVADRILVPGPGIKPRLPTLQADSLPVEPQGKPLDSLSVRKILHRKGEESVGDEGEGGRQLLSLLHSGSWLLLWRAPEGNELFI